jgi:hypothetical protein
VSPSLVFRLNKLAIALDTDKTTASIAEEVVTKFAG